MYNTNPPTRIFTTTHMIWGALHNHSLSLNAKKVNMKSYAHMHPGLLFCSLTYTHMLIKHSLTVLFSLLLCVSDVLLLSEWLSVTVLFILHWFPLTIWEIRSDFLSCNTCSVLFSPLISSSLSFSSFSLSMISDLSNYWKLWMNRMVDGWMDGWIFRWMDI